MSPLTLSFPVMKAFIPSILPVAKRIKSLDLILIVAVGLSVKSSFDFETFIVPF